MKVRAATMIMAMAAAAIAVPLAAAADPPAVSAPALPAPFIGAPTNDNSNNGQFTVNFDDQGRYLGTGTADPHYANFALTQERGHAQAHERSMNNVTGDAVFASFRQRLRDVAAPEAAAVVTPARR